MAAKKNTFLQSVRGICILAVIFIHCYSGVDFGTNTMEFKIWFLIRQFINFPVGVFFFLAGYFTKEYKNRIETKRYYVSRFKKLLYPFFFWSLIYCLFDLIYSLKNGQSIQLSAMVLRIISGRASVQLYYIIVLLQLIILTPLIYKMSKKTKLYMFLISPVYLVLLYLFCFSSGKPFSFYASVFPAWFVFYHMGICVKNGMINIRIQKMSAWIFYFLMVIISTIEAMALLHITQNVSFSVSQVRIGGYLVAIGVIFIIITYNNGGEVHLSTKLMALGDESYGLFYIHYLILQITKRVLVPMREYYFLYVSLVFTLTVCISFLVIKLAKMAVRDKKSVFLEMLGFI